MPTRKLTPADTLNPKKVAAKRMADEGEDSGFGEEEDTPAPAKRSLSKPGPAVDPRKNTKGLAEILKKRGG